MRPTFHGPTGNGGKSTEMPLSIAYSQPRGYLSARFNQHVLDELVIH